MTTRMVSILHPVVSYTTNKQLSVRFLQIKQVNQLPGWHAGRPADARFVSGGLAGGPVLRRFVLDQCLARQMFIAKAGCVDDMPRPGVNTRELRRLCHW